MQSSNQSSCLSCANYNIVEWRISHAFWNPVQAGTTYPHPIKPYVAWLDDTGLAVTSKRSAFMTLTHALMKSRTNFCS